MFDSMPGRVELSRWSMWILQKTTCRGEVIRALFRPRLLEMKLVPDSLMASSSLEPLCWPMALGKGPDVLWKIIRCSVPLETKCHAIIFLIQELKRSLKTPFIISTDVIGSNRRDLGWINTTFTFISRRHLWIMQREVGGRGETSGWIWY